MIDYREKISEAVDYIQSNVKLTPQIGIILGTGLNGDSLTKQIESKIVVNYKDIPNFPIPTVESHDGKLIFGKLYGKTVMIMQGRVHAYEGYSLKEIGFPVDVMKFLGVKLLCVSNAAGGLNPNYKRGDIMIIRDHINMLHGNPLIGKNYDDIGPRFPDMSEPYSKALIELCEKIATENNIKTHKGVYLAVSGPCLETKAEYRAFGILGADVVGMSTIPEVIVAVHAGLKVFGVSVITDECVPETLVPVSLEEMIKAAGEAAPKLITIFTKLIEKVQL